MGPRRQGGGFAARRPGAVLLALAVTLAGVGDSCSGDPGAAAAGTVVGPTTTVATDATPADPLSVVIAGDSVMDNLAEALVPALDFGGSAIVSHQWLLGLTRDTASRLEVRRTVAAADPDVVVVLMGVWELDPLDGVLGTPGWEQRYDRDVLDPFVDMVTAGGAQVLWLGMPATADPTVTDQLTELNRVYRDLDRRDPRVWFVDLGSVLDGPGDTYVDELPGAGGAPERVRQTDGLHLCPQGTVRAVGVVLDRLARQWGVRPAPGWEAGTWRVTQGVEGDEDRCPGD